MEKLFKKKMTNRYLCVAHNFGKIFQAKRFGREYIIHAE